jgi:hypothetical protein
VVSGPKVASSGWVLGGVTLGAWAGGTNAATVNPGFSAKASARTSRGSSRTGLLGRPPWQSALAWKLGRLNVWPEPPLASVSCSPTVR